MYTNYWAVVDLIYLKWILVVFEDLLKAFKKEVAILQMSGIK